MPYFYFYETHHGFLIYIELVLADGVWDTGGIWDIYPTTWVSFIYFFQ